MLRITKQKSVTISNSSGHIHIHSLGSAHASYYQNIPHFRNRCHLHESFPSHTYACDLSLGIYHHSSGLLQESSSFSPGSHSSKYHLAPHQIVRTQLRSGQSLQRLPVVQQVKSKPHPVALKVTGGLAGLQPCPSSLSSQHSKSQWIRLPVLLGCSLFSPSQASAVSLLHILLSFHHNQVKPNCSCLLRSQDLCYSFKFIPWE